MRNYKRGSKWLTISIVVIGVFLLNNLTETVPMSLRKLSSDGKVDFTVLCYNVKCKGEGYEDKQIDMARVIVRESPDIVFLCEFGISESKQLDSIMTQEGHYKRYYRKRSNCIFYSKYEIDSVTAVNVGSPNIRSAINNKVHVYTPYGIITIVGCHLSSSSSGIIDGYRGRKREADSIYKVCMAEEHPIIVMGDMNDVSGSYTINRIKEAGLKDAWWEGGGGYGATFHGKGLRLRIDHILYDYKELELTGVRVIDNNLSDHNALMASFRVKKK